MEAIVLHVDGRNEDAERRHWTTLAVTEINRKTDNKQVKYHNEEVRRTLLGAAGRSKRSLCSDSASLSKRRCFSSSIYTNLAGSEDGSESTIKYRNLHPRSTQSIQLSVEAVSNEVPRQADQSMRQVEAVYTKRPR